MCACEYFRKDKFAEEQSSDEEKHLINLISIIMPASGWATRLRYRNPFLRSLTEMMQQFILLKQCLSGTQHSFSPHVT